MKKFVTLLILLFLAACSSVKTADSAVGNMDENISFKTMLDERVWSDKNLDVAITDSHCQENDVNKCRRYGRLYTWAAAKNACSLLGVGWRLPTLGEWQILAKAYGGIYGEADDKGKSAYIALIEEGNSGFNAVLGGNREANGNFERLGAHGFYWTATEADTAEAWFINFAKGATLVNQHTGDKYRGFSVRCIKD